MIIKIDRKLLEEVIDASFSSVVEKYRDTPEFKTMRDEVVEETLAQFEEDTSGVVTSFKAFMTQYLTEQLQPTIDVLNSLEIGNGE